MKTNENEMVECPNCYADIEHEELYRNGHYCAECDAYFCDDCMSAVEELCKECQEKGVSGK